MWSGPFSFSFLAKFSFSLTGRVPGVVTLSVLLVDGLRGVALLGSLWMLFSHRVILSSVWAGVSLGFFSLGKLRRIRIGVRVLASGRLFLPFGGLEW